MIIFGRDLSGWILVSLAVFFDIFEALIEFATTALGTVAAGAIGGCAIGYHYAGQAGCQIGAAVGGLVGVATNWIGAGEVAGAIVGYVLDIGFSIIAATLLFTFLALTGRMTLIRWMYMIGIFLVKIVPLGNVAPAWSKFTWDCSKPVGESQDTEPVMPAISNSLAQSNV